MVSERRKCVGLKEWWCLDLGGFKGMLVFQEWGKEHHGSGNTLNIMPDLAWSMLHIRWGEGENSGGRQVNASACRYDASLGPSAK
jgi:hypothetical protein